MASLTHTLLQRFQVAPEGSPLPQIGHPISLKVHQTLTQDSTGTMVYLQLEALNPTQLKTECSVAYIDHNMLQSSFENADDHAFIASIARKYGIIYSKPGNGICHQLHLENHGRPGAVLIGSDSHTPTCGALGMLAIGAGGLDVAIGMATGVYTTAMPRVIQVHLIGKRKPWVSSKDVIFSLLKQLTVSGGVGAIIEYTGPGVLDLSVTERATITNMGAELGATTSLFPSDALTLAFLKAMGRESVFVPLAASEDAIYDESIVLDLSALSPMIAMPHSPDKVVEVASLEGLKVDQVAIGSCTNASFSDLMAVSQILKGKTVHPDVSLVISPGSSAVLKLLADNGALSHLIKAGARILEAGCGPCIGMGQAPKSKGISLRTFNRNFPGRSGTSDASVYLSSPEVAAYSALTGCITSPDTNIEPAIPLHPDGYEPTASLWVLPERHGILSPVPVERGPNIKPFPLSQAVTDHLSVTFNLRVGDGISTDAIMPSHAALLPLRSNIPKLSDACFSGVDPDFPDRARSADATLIIAGHNYGQGSSREHAALVPLHLGVRVVAAKSFARIHRANLINSGIIPLILSEDYAFDTIPYGTVFVFEKLTAQLASGQVIAHSLKSDCPPVTFQFDGTTDELDCLLQGGALRRASQNINDLRKAVEV